MPYLFDDGDNADICTVADLLTSLEQDQARLRSVFSKKANSETRVWFRGLRDFSQQNVPTFYRKGHKVEDEIYLMNLFKQNSHEFLTQAPASEWEWMFLMRHHEMPSRLLDWTENPLIALYFSVRPKKGRLHDGVLWCLLPTQLNRLSLGWPEGDYSLPMLTSNSAEYTRAENEVVNLYLPSKMRDLTPGSARPPAAGIATRMNRRMQVQKGVFTIHHVNRDPLESVGDTKHVWRYKIPSAKKKVIYNELRRIGVTEGTLFPSLDNVAKEAAEVSRGR